MIPAIFIPVKKLLFNASGKLERKTLQSWIAGLDTNELGRYYLTDSSTSAAPETAEELQLRAMWAKVLNVLVDTIGADFHFFRSGGDSVVSMRLIAEARSQGVEMTVANVFKAPTLKDMALTMIDSDNDQKASEAVLVEPFSLYKDTASLQKCTQETAVDCAVSPRHD